MELELGIPQATGSHKGRADRGFEQGPGIPGSFREVLGLVRNFLDASGLSRRYERLRGGRLGT